MSGVRRIDADTYETCLDWLAYVAGADLAAEVVRAEDTDDCNPAKVIETLREISKHAREVALYLETRGTI